MKLLSLIGDIDENFYQLGLSDREPAKDVHKDVLRMLSTPWAPVNRAILEIAKMVVKNTLLKKAEYYNHLNSYAEGLGVKKEDAAMVMLVPEIVSCMSKWAPGMMKGPLGCSSFLMRNEEGEVVHGRVLDFPLQGAYDTHERGIFYDLKGMPKTFGLGSSGIPYPSITLMTEEGMTLSLHQKFTNVFNKDGVSIFALIMDLIKNAGDKQSVLEYLRAHESITTWCLYMSFKNGDVLGVDIMGKELYANEQIVPDNGVLYFCNKLEDPRLNQMELLPTGITEYNQMRENIAHKKIQNFLGKKKKSELDLIHLMSAPLEQKIKEKGHYEHYQMDTATPSSLSIMTLNPVSQKVLYIDGDAPKLFRHNVLEISECFIDPRMKEVPSKKMKAVSPDYYEGMRSLMKAQKGFDEHNSQAVYHHLQFAIDHLEHFPELGTAKFYFLVAQYIFESHPKVLMTLLHDLKKMEGHLPPNLNDHCLLFIGRLERILQVGTTLEEDKIKHPKLRALYNLELKIPRPLIHLTTKGMIIPRIDIMDVIYVHIS